MPKTTGNREAASRSLFGQALTGRVYIQAAAGQQNGNSSFEGGETDYGALSAHEVFVLPTGELVATVTARGSNVGALRSLSSAITYVTPQGSAGSANASAHVQGGDLIVLDVRKYSGVLPGTLSASFAVDGALTAISLNGHAVARLDWAVRDLVGSFGAGLSERVQSSSGLPAVHTTVDGLRNTQIGISYRWAMADGTTTIEPQVGQRPAFGVLAYSESLNTQAQAIGGGSAGADFYGTAKLTALLLPDGSTPESRGMDLYFLSGQPSPNLQPAAVPEPASLALWSLVALGCTASGYRRRSGGTP